MLNIYQFKKNIFDGINNYIFLLYFIFLYFYRTALHVAIQRENLEIIELLLNNERTYNLSEYIFKRSIIFL